MENKFIEQQNGKTIKIMYLKKKLFKNVLSNSIDSLQ